MTHLKSLPNDLLKSHIIPKLDLPSKINLQRLGFDISNQILEHDLLHKTSPWELMQISHQISPENMQILAEKILKFIFGKAMVQRVITQVFAEFLSTAPENVGLIYILEANLLLPESFLKPLAKAKVKEYLQEFHPETLSGIKNLLTFSRLILMFLEYKLLAGHNSKHVRLRIIPLKKSKINFHPYYDLTANSSFIYQNDHLIDSIDEKCRKYLCFYDTDGHFWKNLKFEHEKLKNNEILLPNYIALCYVSRTDLGKLLEISMIGNLEIYGLYQFELSYLSYMTGMKNTKYVDWKFIGMVIQKFKTGTSENSIHLCGLDFYLPTSTGKLKSVLENLKSINTRKMIEELYFSENIGNFKFSYLNLEEDSAFRLLHFNETVSSIEVQNIDEHFKLSNG